MLSGSFTMRFFVVLTLISVYLLFVAADPVLAQMTDGAETTPGGKIITLDDNDKTTTLQVNETFLLKLGEFYDWNITIDDQTIVSRVVNVLVVKGAQGIYRAHKPGSAMLTATGDPICRKTTPPCQAPSILFKLNIVVTGSPTATPRTPAFESILSISMMFAALLFRRKKLN